MKHLRHLAVVLLTLSMALVGLAKIGTEFQMQLGNASNASADPTNHSHYLIQRAQYALDYNDLLGIPNWVSWDLTTADRGSSGRNTSFYVDTSLPAGFTLIGTSYDYATNTLDRGHMCPSADRTITVEDNKALFLMSNILPQAPDNNQGIWNNFEGYCRTLADAGNELLITSGPMGYSTGKVIVSDVSVPDFVWKIVVVVPAGTGTALERATADCRVIAIKVPNVQGIRTTPWQTYITSVAQIEADTGFHFFSALPDTVANALRAKVDGGSTGGGSAVVIPAISSQPASQTVLIGSNALFSVTASNGGGTLSYQWFKDGLEIANATGGSYTVSSVSNASAGSYTVAVTNSAGSVTSNDAILTVTTQVVSSNAIVWNFDVSTPAVASVPSGLSVSAISRGNHNIANDSAALLNTTANSNGSNGTYPGASGGNNIAGAAIAGTYTPAPNNLLYFEVTLTAAPDRVVTLEGISLGSRSSPTGPKVIGLYTAANAYATALCTFSTPLTLNGTNGMEPDSKWYLYSANVSSSNFPQQTITPGQAYKLRIYGYNARGNSSSSTWRVDDLKLSVSVVSSTPAISTQPLDVSGAAGGTAGFSVVASGPGTLHYQWRKDGSPILGNVSATTASLALSSLGAADIGSYDCVVSNEYASQTSSAASLSVNQSYAAWAAAKALPAGRDAQSDDADGDGVQNVVEYALGLNPLLPDSQLLPACVLTDGQAAFRFQRQKLAEGFAYVVETSTDLNTWQQLGAAVESSTVSSDTLVTLVPADAPRRFFRLVFGTARTVPVGYTRISLAGAAASTAFAPVLDDVQSPLAGIRSGTVDTVTATTLGNASGAWSGNLADPSAPWALRIASGAAAGRQFDVKANTATTLTVTGVDLTTLGILAGTDRFELIPLETLGTLFGSSTLQGGTSSATADIVQLRSGAIWLAFYYDTAFGHWRRTVGTATNCDTTIVRPGTGLMIQRRGTALSLVLTGRVLASPFRTLVAKAGSTVISLGYPTDTTLGALAVQTLLPGWRTGSLDQVLLHNGTAWVGYFHNGTAWVRSSDLSPANTLAVPGTTALYLQRSGTTAGTVDLVRNLSF